MNVKGIRVLTALNSGRGAEMSNAGFWTKRKLLALARKRGDPKQVRKGREQQDPPMTGCSPGGAEQRGGA